ncbi:MAG: hypothetical protein PHS44_00025 [Candidatus Dojkabacteria bacterium]|jgi:hypothetical protein|nr:hypothetical protein [Candidatus Dojkabacteria bacterium]
MKNSVKAILFLLIVAGVLTFYSSTASAEVGEPGGIGVQQRPQDEDQDGSYGEDEGNWDEETRDERQIGYGHDN